MVSFFYKFLSITLICFSLLIGQNSINPLKESQVGSMTSNEMQQKAKELGVSQKDINNAIENIQKDNQQINDNQTGNEIIVEQPQIVDEISKKPEIEPEKKDESDQIEKKSSSDDLNKQSRFFGYDIFRAAPTNFNVVQQGPVNPDYQIGPGDQIIITMWGKTELRYSITVSREGTIFITNVGLISINGLTLEKLQQKLIKRFSKVYQSLSPVNNIQTTFLDVTLGKLRPITVYFLGEVKMPGAFQLSSYSTVFTALYSVGGPTLNGSLRNIQVIRDGHNIATLDLYKYLLSGKDFDDIRLTNNDCIFIPFRGKTVTINNEVRRPGSYELIGQESLRELVEYSGGLNTVADLNRVQIERILSFEDRENTGKNVKTVVDADLVKYKDQKVEINPIKLFDKDMVTIYSLVDPQRDFVTITGAVARPGKYAITSQMTLRELIIKCQGLLPNAYLEKANLVRNFGNIKRKLYSINLASTEPDTFKLKEWDNIRIYSIWELYDRETVSITGHVRNSGEYQLNDSMRVSDLIFMSGGLEDPEFWKHTFQKRADLFRLSPDKISQEIIPIKLDSLMAGDKKQDILLKNNDRLKIYNMTVIYYPKNIRILGEVKNPGEYNLQENATIHDILLQAGGFTRQAYKYELEVYRIDPYNILPNKLSVRHKIEIDPKMMETTFHIEDGFKLESNDIILVKHHPDYQLQKIVNLGGEVKFPGIYPLLNEGETFCNIIKRAGGLTKNAFIDGIQFSRNGKRVGGDYKKVLFGDSKYDLVVRNGDLIQIPVRPGVIEIQGRVNNPGIYKYQENWKLKDYIKTAGGYRQDADKGDVSVYYASGEARSKFLIFMPDVKEGSRVVIGTKPEGKDIDWANVIKESINVTSSMVTILFVISKL